MKTVKPKKRSGGSKPKNLAPPVRNQARQGFRQFHAALPSTAPASWPSISVCLIVKDEEAHLRDCLASLGDLASEIIVVDTGSTDRTVQIAELMGAKVFHFPWSGDFAAARNESLEHARGEWIFWLDADDRLSPHTVAQLKSAAAAGIADSYGCLVSSKTSGAGDEVTEHVRLFRNTLGIRFVGSIHETVYPYLVDAGLSLARTDMLITHLGYETVEAKQRKGMRNLAIIEAQMALRPDDFELVFYRGQARGLLNDADGLEWDMRHFLSLTVPADSFDFKRFWAYISLSGIYERRGPHESLVETLDRALAEFPNHPGFLVVRARDQLATSRVEAAVESLRAAHKAMQGPVRGLKPSDSLVESCLAQAYQAQNRTAEALEWAKKAWDHAPNSLEAAVLLSRLYTETGRTANAERVLRSQLGPEAGPEPWLVMVEIRAKEKRWDEALSAAEEARHRGLSSQSYAALMARLKTARLMWNGETPAVDPAEQLRAAGLAMLSQGDPLKAAEHFAEAVEQAPTDPENYRYLAAALKGLGREEEALDAWRLGQVVAKQAGGASRR